MRFGKAVLRVLIFLVIAAALVVGGKLLLKKKQAALAEAPQFGLRPLAVRAAVAREGDLIVTIDYLGVVEPVREASISARLTAVVEEVPLDEGDPVRKGEVLVRLDGREIRNDIETVEAQIEQTKAERQANEALVQSLESSLRYWRREAERDKILADKGDIPAAQAEATADKVAEFDGKLKASKGRSDAIQHQVSSLESQKEEFYTRLGYCTLLSPYNGLVTSRTVDPGDLAAPGVLLMTVEDRSSLKIAFDIPQQDLPDVREGLDLVFDTGAVKRRAKLSHLYPSLDAARMLRAEANLTGSSMQGISCGQYVPISLIIEVHEAITLAPASCLIEGSDKTSYIFLINENVLVPKPVEVVGFMEDSVGVKGIKPGDRVVTNTFLGWTALSAGRKVEVIQ